MSFDRRDILGRRGQQMPQPRADASPRIGVELRGDPNIGVAQGTAGRVDAELGADL